MKPNSLVAQFFGACGVGVFIGRMSVSLPLELRLHEGNGGGAASQSLAVLYAESLSSPPLALLELTTLLLPLALAVAAAVTTARAVRSSGASSSSSRFGAVSWLILAVVNAAATLWRGSPALLFFVGHLGDPAGTSEGGQSSPLPGALLALHGGSCAAAALAVATALASSGGRRVSGGRSSTDPRNLTDRAIKEHSKLHAFLHGRGGGDEDDGNAGSTFDSGALSNSALSTSLLDAGKDDGDEDDDDEEDPAPAASR